MRRSLALIASKTIGLTFFQCYLACFSTAYYFLVIFLSFLHPLHFPAEEYWRVSEKESRGFAEIFGTSVGEQQPNRIFLQEDSFVDISWYINPDPFWQNNATHFVKIFLEIRNIFLTNWENGEVEFKKKMAKFPKILHLRHELTGAIYRKRNLGTAKL